MVSKFEIDDLNHYDNDGNGDQVLAEVFIYNVLMKCHFQKTNRSSQEGYFGRVADIFQLWKLIIGRYLRPFAHCTIIVHRERSYSPFYRRQSYSIP